MGWGEGSDLRAEALLSRLFGVVALTPEFQVDELVVYDAQGAAKCRRKLLHFSIFSRSCGSRV